MSRLTFDLSEEFLRSSESLPTVGGKGKNLSVLADIEGIHTKPGMVVTSDAYIEIARPLIAAELQLLNVLIADIEGNKQKIEALLKTIRDKIDTINFDDIASEIAGLPDGKDYAVRSSGTAEDGQASSFSGKFSTSLHIQKSDIPENIKKVWGSLFTLSNIEYCKSQNVDFAQLDMAVVIQEMSHPLSAGTVFISENGVEIDVAPGLGEAVVRGDKPVDRVVLSPDGKTIVFVESSKKSEKLVYDVDANDVVERRLEENERFALSLSTEQIRELNRQAQIVKEAYKLTAPYGVDIEFACDQRDGRVYMLQVRPVTIEPDTVLKQVDYTKIKLETKPKDPRIGSASPVSFHVAAGIVAVCDTPGQALEAIDHYKPKKVIIVTANTTSEWESVMRRSAGVIAEVGSVNSHTGIACREMGIPGVTNYAGAKSQLRHYQGKEITLCGVSGNTYLGKYVDEQYLIPVGELATKYTVESEETISREAHYRAASAARQTVEGDAGKRWIGKPITPTCPLLNEIDRAAHIKVQENCRLKKAEYNVTSDHRLLMNFDDCHDWRMQIREWSIHEHERVLAERKAAEKYFADTSNQLSLTEEAFSRWFDAYERKIGYDNIAYPIGEVVTGMLHALAEDLEIREPVLSALITAEVACLGHFVQEVCNEELRNIQRELKGTESLELIQELEALYRVGGADAKTIQEKESQLLEKLHRLHLDGRCKEVATSYRIKESDFALTVLEDWFQQSSAPWLRLLIESGKLTNPPPQALSQQKRTYFPEETELRQLIKLAAESKKLHMDGHQTKARGLWQFVNKMQELSAKAGIPISDLFKMNKQGIKTVIKQVRLQSLSERTGYEVVELEKKSSDELNELEVAVILQTVPGKTPRVLSSRAEAVLSAYEAEQNGLVLRKGYALADFTSEDIAKLIMAVGRIQLELANALPKVFDKLKTIQKRTGDYKSIEFTSEELKAFEQVFRDSDCEALARKMASSFVKHRISNAAYVNGVAKFCEQLSTLSDTVSDQFQMLQERTVYAPNNEGLAKRLEEFEDRMSAESESINDPEKYRGEYVRPSRTDTQRQILLPSGRVVTMVSLENSKPMLTVGSDAAQIGVPFSYSSSYKWQNPALMRDSSTSLLSEHYDRITSYGQFVDERLKSGFAKLNITEQIKALEELISEYNVKSQSSVFNSSAQLFYHRAINTNEPAKMLSVLELLQNLKTELLDEQHMLAITGNQSEIIYGMDGAAPKMQSVVRVPGAEQHEQFLNDVLFYFNTKLNKNADEMIDEHPFSGRAEISEVDLLQMNNEVLANFLAVDESSREKFYQSLDDARKYREYQRKPKLSANTQRERVEISMNDSIDLPTQALMMVHGDGNPISTNRHVNLARGYQSLMAVLETNSLGPPEDIILANLAYTQASSTQSMIHYHVMPLNNSEGRFVVPYLDDGMGDAFGGYQITGCDGIQVAYLDDETQEDYFNLVKFKIQLDPNDQEANMKRFAMLDQKLQRWEVETGGDMTWVAKFESNSNSVTICVELRAGINQFSQAQIDELRARGLWNKIGFIEVMGKKISMLSQRNIDDAIRICDDESLAALKQKMLSTPLHAMQVSPDGRDQSMYEFKDKVPELANLEPEQVQIVMHVARLLQIYDAEQYTKSAAALYHLKPEEMTAFKNLFKTPQLALAHNMSPRSLRF